MLPYPPVSEASVARIEPLPRAAVAAERGFDVAVPTAVATATSRDRGRDRARLHRRGRDGGRDSAALTQQGATGRAFIVTVATADATAPPSRAGSRPGS